VVLKIIRYFEIDRAFSYGGSLKAGKGQKVSSSVRKQ